MRLLAEEPELYPEILIDKELPSTVARGRMKQALKNVPEKHLTGLRNIEIKNFLHVEGAPAAGAYWREKDKIQYDYDCLGTRKGDEIVLHEVGHHVYDDIISDKAKREWQRIWGESRGVMPTGYAKTCASEGFAEYYQYYMRDKVPKKDTSARRFLHWWFEKNVGKGEPK